MCKIIASEHAKQTIWKQTVQLEKEQQENESCEKDNAREKEMKERRAEAEYELGQEEAKLRGVVKELVHNVSVGDGSINNVVKTTGVS